MACDVRALLENEDVTHVCAPMVRYSRLPFRSLVRQYGCHLCFTPMTIAESFINSSEYRKVDFVTNKDDWPLIVQFAARTPEEFALAAELVAPYCNGVDLNCGCPQTWVKEWGCGCHLLNEPQLVKDMVLQVKNRIPPPFSVSVKIRILSDIRKTVNFARNLEAAGITFLTVHGRTPSQRRDPVNLPAIKLLQDNLNIPVIGNGGVSNLKDVHNMAEKTGCKGVMAASSLLDNPALFAGYTRTPLECVKMWLALSEIHQTNFYNFSRHLLFMLSKELSKPDKITYGNLKDKRSIISFLKEISILDKDFEIKNIDVSPDTICDYSSVINKLNFTPKYQSVYEESENEDFVSDLCTIFV